MTTSCLDFSPRLPVTVAIVTFNEEERIERCLVSLLHSAAEEILVVDNKSTDRTLSIVRSYASRNRGPKIRIIEMPENHLGNARQRAAEEGAYLWIAFLDADCTAPEGWLTGLFGFFQKNTDQHLLAAGSGNYCSDTNSAFHGALRLVLSSFWGHLGSVQAHCLAQARQVAHLSTCNVLYERERLLAAGGFSDEFDYVCEDLEFSLRARKQGWRFIYTPGWEVSHDHRPSVMAWIKKMVRYGRGQILVFRRHIEHGFSVKALPFLFGLFFLASAIFRPYFFLMALLVYLSMILALSLWLSIRAKNFHLTPLVALLFISTHWGYSLGELWEAWNLVFGFLGFSVGKNG